MDVRRDRPRHAVPPIRRHRQGTLWAFGAALVLTGVLVWALVRPVPQTFEIREDRLMTTPIVHVLGEENEELTAAAGADPSVGSADSSLSQREPLWVRYPVPLDDELQRHICEKCRGTDIPAAVVMGMIAVETGGTFDASLVGDGGNSIGLMQIFEGYHTDRMRRLGVFDLEDPFQNVDVGIDVLEELSDYEGRDRPIEWVLMAYNGGPGYADEHWDAGEVSIYAQRVISLSEEYLEAGQAVMG